MYLREERGYRCLAAHAPEAIFFHLKHYLSSRSHLAFAPRALDDGAAAKSNQFLMMERHENNQGIAYQLAWAADRIRYSACLSDPYLGRRKGPAIGQKRYAVLARKRGAQVWALWCRPKEPRKRTWPQT
jgi:hypothetical protein